MSSSDLFIPRNGSAQLSKQNYNVLQPNRQADPEIYKLLININVGTGNEAALFHLWENINRTFGTLLLRYFPSEVTFCDRAI